MLVFDASPLIVLSSAKRLELLATFDPPLIVPEPVRREAVDAGMDGGYEDARRLAKAIESGMFTVSPVESTVLFQELLNLDTLSEADAAVLAHAEDTDGIAIIDESAGRSIARTEGIRTRGTAWLVLSRVQDGALTPEEGRAAIDDLVESGWYCSTDLYRRILQKLESLQ